MDPGLAAQLAGFREARRELEASILPLATSVDGRRFSFQASLNGLSVQAGGYVVLDDGGITRLGQVITLDLGQLSTELMLPAPADGAQGNRNRTQMLIQYARGEGVILEGDFAPFHDVTVRPASGAEVRAWLEHSARPEAQLLLGELASLTDVPCTAQGVFSFVPPSLIDRAVAFHQGEALIAGKISPQPALLRFGARISEEGGADVPRHVGSHPLIQGGPHATNLHEWTRTGRAR